METQCPQKITAIDHLAIEFTAINNLKYIQIIDLLKGILREYNIRIGSKSPHTLGCYRSGNLLHSALKGMNKKTTGSLKYLPMKKRIKLELNGSQCALIELTPKAFESLYYLAIQFQGVIRRIDIYYDDFTGLYNIRRAQKDVSKGMYKPKTGPSPKVSYLGRPASTMYIGSTKSSRFIRIYDKAIEQKLLKTDPLYCKWNRHEAVLKNQGKTEIPLLGLIQSDRLFLGAFQRAHKKFIAVGKPLDMQWIVAKHVSTELSKKQRYAQRQHGRLINLLDDLVDDPKLIIDCIKRPGEPRGIEIPTALDKKQLSAQVIASLNAQKVGGLNAEAK